MENAGELNLKLLERSLELHEAARASFFRDLKIVAVILLVFQFLVFFRFASLSDQQLAVRNQLHQAVNNQQALQAVQAPLEGLKQTLKTGTATLSQSLESVPQEIREQLGNLAGELEDFRNRPLESRTPRELFALNVAQNVAQNAAQNARFAPDEIGFLRGFTRSEKTTLHDSTSQDPDYQSLVERIVQNEIIQPVFRELNEQANDVLAQPLAARLAELKQLEQPLATLKRNGADVDGWIAQLERVTALAAGLTFAPPAASDWWRSSITKGDFARSAQLNTAKIAEEASAALSSPDRELASLATKLDAAVAGLTQQGAQLEAELAQLQANARSLESLVEGYAKPLAVVALEPRDLVLFYPVVLAALIATFAGRHILLRRRAAALADAYRELGLSNRILDVYFTELPAAESGQRTPGRLAEKVSSRRLAGLWWVVPASFAVVSFGWVLASKSLGGEAPRTLYAVAALILVVACILLLRLGEESKPVAPATAKT